MEPRSARRELFKPSYITGVEPQRTGRVDYTKADLTSEFSLVSSDTNQWCSSEPKGHIQVCLRVRPLTSLEKENELQGCVSLEDSRSILLKPPKASRSRPNEKTPGQMIQKFTFSRVFGPETTQEEFFEGAMKQPVQDFLDGSNRLIFTYGVTNAGKTYTFQGTEDDAGILPRSMKMLFNSIKGKIYLAMDFKPYQCRDYVKLTEEQVREEITIKNSILGLTKEVDHQNSINNKTAVDSNDLGEWLDLEQSSTTVKNHVKFSVWVSFFEIYNECFYDLLNPMSNKKKRKTLRLAQDIKGFSYVKDLQWVNIIDSKEAFQLLKVGLKHQSSASTKLNSCSSRSHSIFTVKILRIEDFGMPRVTQVNELSLCDLAGSERYTKTHNEGDRLKESGNINTSLLTLGKCINALKSSQQSKLQQHIPFRESKLTHFLQGYFSGKGKILMIVNISQCASTYDETLSALRFSAMAQKLLVMDTPSFPRDQSFGQKAAHESSLLSYSKMPVPKQNVTILWDRSLDVIEDYDEPEEQKNMSREEAVQKYEDNKVLIGQKEYMALVSLIEYLKNKLITEKKKKFLLELEIREEVIQEFVKYFVEQGLPFKECLSYERERIGETSGKCLDIFKEHGNYYPRNADENKFSARPCIKQARPLDEERGTGPGACIGLEDSVDVLQNYTSEVKKQTGAAHKYSVSLEGSNEAISWQEKHLEKLTTELNKTKKKLAKVTNKLIRTEEELTQRNRDIEIQTMKLDESAEQLKVSTETLNAQHKKIQELMDIVEMKDDAILRLQDLILSLEATMEDYDTTINTIKRNLVEKNSDQVTESQQLKDCKETAVKGGRKRCLAKKTPVQEEPPTKKGTISTLTHSSKKNP